MDCKGGRQVKLKLYHMLEKMMVFLVIITIPTLLMIDYTIMAKSKPTKGEDANGNIWTYNKKTKTLTFEGEKDLEENLMDGHSSEPDWFYWDEETEHVIIKEGITGLPGGEFDSFTELKTVILSDTVTYIGNGVFADCMRLKEIQFSKNITIIGDYAFDNCRALTSIQIPEKVVTIGSCAFSGSENLKEINISICVKKIGAGAFVDCKNLKRIKLPNNLKIINEYLFYGCKNLANVTIPESVTTIYAGAFQESGIKQIVIPKNVKYIKKGEWGDGVFADCKNLKTIEVKSKKIESCFKGAFENVNKNVVIKVPKSKLTSYKAMFHKSGLSKEIKITCVS